MKKTTLFFFILIGVSTAQVLAAEKTDGSSTTHPTCGQMISSMAAIPAKLSEGAASVADMLDAHIALMGNDKASQAEVKGMRGIAKTHRQVSANLLKASEEMKKASNWPDAPHDMEKYGKDPKVAETSKRVIQVHKEIIAMLQKMVADMEAQGKPKK
jgi:hypothetical protein